MSDPQQPTEQPTEQPAETTTEQPASEPLPADDHTPALPEGDQPFGGAQIG